MNRVLSFFSKFISLLKNSELCSYYFCGYATNTLPPFSASITQSSNTMPLKSPHMQYKDNPIHIRVFLLSARKLYFVRPSLGNLIGVPAIVATEEHLLIFLYFGASSNQGFYYMHQSCSI